MKKAEIHVGGIHLFQVKNTSDIISGKIVKDLGNKYLCEIAEYGAFYHIRKNGEVILYSELPIFYTNEYMEGLFVLTVPVMPNCVYLFDITPVESEKSFLISDLFLPYLYLIDKSNEKFIRYKRGIDREIDSMFPEDGPCHRHGEE